MGEFSLLSTHAPPDTVTQSEFIIEELHQSLCGNAAASRSEAKTYSDLLTWRLDITSAWCLLSAPKPRWAAVDHLGGAGWWRESALPTSNACAEAIKQLNVFCREDTIMTHAPDQCVICWFWQWMNIEYRCSCFLGHISGTPLCENRAEAKWDLKFSKAQKARTVFLELIFTLWGNLHCILSRKVKSGWVKPTQTTVSDQKRSFMFFGLRLIPYLCHWKTFRS